MASEFTMEQWAGDKKDTWLKVCEKYGGDKKAFDWGTWFFFDWSLGKAWPTLGTASKARKLGWTRYDDTFETWVETFKTFESAGILPRQGYAQVEAALNSKSSQPTVNSGKVNGVSLKENDR